MVFKAAMKLDSNHSLNNFFFLQENENVLCNPFFNVIFPRSFTLLPLDASQRNIAVKK